MLGFPTGLIPNDDFRPTVSGAPPELLIGEGRKRHLQVIMRLIFDPHAMITLAFCVFGSANLGNAASITAKGSTSSTQKYFDVREDIFSFQDCLSPTFGRDFDLGKLYSLSFAIVYTQPVAGAVVWSLVLRAFWIKRNTIQPSTHHQSLGRPSYGVVVSAGQRNPVST
jgi:hypothetical protein